MLKLPFRAKLFPGWLMKSWYLTDDSDDGSGENPDGGDDGGTGSETEPGPADDPNDGDDDDTGNNGTAKVSTTSELSEALEDESITEVILESNITDAVGLSVTSGDKTINLNGHSITAASDLSEDNWAIKAFGGTLTITGDGSVNGGSGCPNDVCVWAYGEGTQVIIESGSYDVGLDVNGDTNSTIYSEGGAVISIYGGDFSNSGSASVGATGTKAYVLNLKNNDGSYIYCYGGTYHNQNPADGDDKDTTTGATFVADGCSVTETSDNVYVVS